MVNPVVLTLLIVLGLLFGSFAGAMVWRLRSRQLLFEKNEGGRVSKNEWARLEPLTKKSLLRDRSQCLYCGYELKWYDLIPLVSWLSLRGRCRSCKKKIGRMEPLIELGMAVFFAASYVFWPFMLETPFEIAYFGVWLAAGVGLGILFAYDAKWFLLPNPVTWTVVGLSAVSVVLRMLIEGQVVEVALQALGAVAVLSGLYLLLYLLSKGKWIGFGDVKLGLALGLLLADWQLALLALFAANLLGCLYVIPGMVSKKLSRTSHVPFGPFLIVGMVIAQLFGWYLIEWYSIGLI